MLAACQQAQGSQQSESVRSPYFATAVGRVDSQNEARQLVAEVDGVIEAVLVQRGEAVKKGQPLLRISCAPRIEALGARLAAAAQAQASADTVIAGPRREEIAGADAELSAARAGLQDAEDGLRRAEALKEKGFVTRRELETRANGRAAAAAKVTAATAHRDMLVNGPRSSEIATARAASRAAQAEGQVASAVASQCVVRSPIDGRVLQIMRQPGEFSAASQGLPLIIVGDMSQLMVRAEINERDAAAVRTGQSATVWVEGQRERWKGRVIHLASVMGRRTARSLDPTDRFDRDVREALIAFDGTQPPELVGLRVTVGLSR